MKRNKEEATQKYKVWVKKREESTQAKHGEGTPGYRKNKTKYNPAVGKKRLGWTRGRKAVEAMLKKGLEERKAEEAATAATVKIPREDGVAFLTAKSGEHVWVDDDVYLKYCKNKICLHSSSYANVLGKLLHSLICPHLQPNHCIDHINHNKLDNCHCNLCLVTHSVNNLKQRACSNTGALGVHTDAHGHHWASVLVRRDPMGFKGKPFKSDCLKQAKVWVANMKRHRNAGEFGPM